MKQKIEAPTPEDIQRIAQQFLVANQLASEHLGRELAGDSSDLDVLQALLDAGVLAATATFELQCLGIVFGKQVVDAVADFDWAVVEDEYGRDPAIRFLDTSLLAFPLTMISKRIEDGESVNVRSMFDLLCARLEELKTEVDRPS